MFSILRTINLSLRSTLSLSKGRSLVGSVILFGFFSVNFVRFPLCILCGLFFTTEYTKILHRVHRDNSVVTAKNYGRKILIPEHQQLIRNKLLIIYLIF